MTLENGNSDDVASAAQRPRSLPEITIKAVILGVILSAVLAGANAYLGLKVGMTVSASIPAAVLSMAVLKLFRRSNILENNIVQTAASAGESLAAGVVFTLPALIILKTWTEFSYWQTTVIAGLGGMLGVLFTIPLRRALIVEAKLKYPEGVATAEVLRVGDAGRGGIRQIVFGAVMGAVFKFGETGMALWTGSVEVARRWFGGLIAYMGLSVGPALVAVGYIVGINIAVLVFVGGAINWLVAIPWVAATSSWPVEGLEPMPAEAFAWQIWSTQTRYIGVGAMVVGGLWAVVRLMPSLVRGIASSLSACRQLRAGAAGEVPRTERDTPIRWVGIALVLSVVPLYFVFRHVTGSTGIAAVMAVVMLLGGFLFSAVASYMAGVVGSSNNPISGVTIATILSSALLLLGLGTGGVAGPAAAILIGAVVCCAAAIGGDNLQDLKTGHLVGATPWKQQVMQAVGVLAAAVVIAPVLTLLLEAYGIGEVTAAHPKPLKAPQATLMASVARGVFTWDLPWPMIWIGMGIAVAIIAVDLALEYSRSAFRTPVLAVAVGIYLPLELGTGILLGGLVALAAKAFSPGTGPKGGPQKALLLAAGLITGEALMGILLAMPIVACKGVNPLKIEGVQQWWPGLVLLGAVIAVMLVVATRRDSMSES